MTKKLSVDLKLFCPQEDCTYRNDSKNKITKDGFYTTKMTPNVGKCCIAVVENIVIRIHYRTLF